MSDLISADTTLKRVVGEMMNIDKRFVGLSRYLDDISFYWSTRIDTACAGDGFIFFNPNFWDKLVSEERKTVVAHEIWHLILDHLNRGEGLDPDDYNIANDHVINLGLNSDGFKTQTPTNFDGGGILCDPQYRNMSSEQIYRIIHQKKKQNPTDPKLQPAKGTPSNDQIEDLIKQALEGKGKDLSQNKEENQQKLEEAIRHSPPGSHKGFENTMIIALKRKVHVLKSTYNEIFEPYLIDPLTGGKRTFMRPSRRQIKGGLRLKGKYPKRGKHNRLTHLVYGLDVSGSISAKDRVNFLSSAKTLKELLKPELMTVIFWDTQIQFEKVFRADETLNNIHIRAGGGTNLNPLYRRVEQINPEAVVIFTDLQVTMPPPPDCDVIWFVPDTGVKTSHVNKGKIYLIPEENT